MQCVEQDNYTLESMGISAPRVHWAALGCTVLTDLSVGYTPHGTEELLALALAAGASGADAVAWALAERQRRNEVSARTAAEAANAEAVRRLADAIRTSSEKDVLQRILGRLTERTQYAVRQQLGQ